MTTVYHYSYLSGCGEDVKAEGLTEQEAIERAVNIEADLYRDIYNEVGERVERRQLYEVS